MKKTISRPGIILLLSMMLLGCHGYYGNWIPYEYTIKKKSFTKNNPVEYIYDIPLDTLHYVLNYNIINTNKGDYTLGQIAMNSTKYYKDNDSIINFFPCREQIKYDFNDYDFCITTLNYNSIIYYAKETGKPLLADLIYYIHLEPISKNRTRVIVDVLDYKVMYGETIGLKGTALFKRVEPTTVEEYLFLTKIGDYFNVKGMPEVILPEE